MHLIALEDGPLYNRMALGELLHAPAALERLWLREPDWASQHDIRVWTGTGATAIDRRNRTIVMATGERLPYDRMILATGASATKLDLPGSELAGVYTLRTAADASTLGRKLADGIQRAVVVGGGPLGVETAVGLHAQGVAVTLVVRGERLMRGLLDDRGAELLRAALAATGIEVEAHSHVTRLSGESRLERVELADGRVLPAKVLVACIGIDRHTELASAAGLAVERGVVVDEQLRTSDPSIFAVGDAAQYGSRPGGLWSPAVRQAEVAARNATGEAIAYAPAPELTQMRLAAPGIDVVVVGERGDDEPIVLEDPALGSYRRLDSTDGRLTGAVLFNARRWERVASGGVVSELRVDTIRERLAAGDWELLRASNLERPAPSVG